MQKTITHKGISFTIGENIKVSDHYAGYKSQYKFLNGCVILIDEKPCVKINIKENDIEQNKIISLDCFETIEKY